MPASLHIAGVSASLCTLWLWFWIGVRGCLICSLFWSCRLVIVPSQIYMFSRRSCCKQCSAWQLTNGSVVALRMHPSSQLLHVKEYADFKWFLWWHCGAAAGGNDALIQLGEQGKNHFSMKGLKSYIAWRSAYLTRLGNAQNRFYVIVNWLTTRVFGRDMSRW